ncbi:MAG TPA: ATP-binding cassette domain-containing protein [Acidimicrobiales bacterium]|nr:ATP-binding cassette domain-containing protein [Acidimicrobiales bacterium]
MSTSGPAVEAHALTKKFGNFTAVDAFDFIVARGTVLALLGPNGAGKTTVVRMLATLSRPTGGSATVCGYDIVREPDKVRSVISLTGQFAALEANLSAKENLILMARLRGYNRQAAARVAASLVERYNIEEFQGKLVKKLSGGERRRVDLAASLVTEPQLVVLDEPTTGLDPRSRQVVWSTVRQLRAEGVTLLLTTQYLEEADELADQIVFIDHGRGVAAGAPAELKAQIGDHRVDVVARDEASFEQLDKILELHFPTTSSPERRTISVPAPRQAADLASVTNLVVSSGAAVEEVALRRPTLDDAFLALTGSRSGTDQSQQEVLA